MGDSAFCSCPPGRCPGCGRPRLTSAEAGPSREERSVLAAALRWWEGKRPVGWTTKDHLDHPAVNATETETSRRLATSVAKLIKARKGIGGNMDAKKVGLALLAVMLLGGCALKFEARLLDPWNRATAMEDERRLVLQARQMLGPCTGDVRLCSMSRDEAVKNLEARGLANAEAERIVAMAQAANAAAANK